MLINALGGGHTETDRQTHIPVCKQKRFQETRCMWPKAACTWFNKQPNDNKYNLHILVFLCQKITNLSQNYNETSIITI